MIGSRGEEKNGELVLISIGDGTTAPKVVQSLTVGKVPSSIAIMPNGARLFVGHSLDVYVADVMVSDSSLDVVNKIQIQAPTSLAITPDGSRLYVAGQNYLVLFDVTKNPPTSIPFSNIYGSKIVMSPDGSRLYALRSGTEFSSISCLDITGATLREAQSEVPFYGQAIATAVAPDGVNIYATYRDLENSNGMLLVASPVSAA